MKKTIRNRMVFALGSMIVVLFYTTNTSAAYGYFTDVDKVPWAKEAIYALSNAEIVGGYGDGRFGPNDPITREQVATMLTKDLFPNEAAHTYPTFKDVHNDSFYFDFIALAVEKGLMNGYPNGLFLGSEAITREEAAVVIDNAYDFSGHFTNRFTDVDRNRWSARSIGDLSSKGIINGYPDGTFQPTKPVTRAEFAVMLSAAKSERLPDNIKNNPYGKFDLDRATINQLNDPNYGNQIRPYDLMEKLENGESVTVLFYHPICVFCQQTIPYLVPLAEDYGINIRKFNVLEFGREAIPFAIQSTPTLVHYENGKEVGRIVGQHSEQEFLAFFSAYILE